MVVFIFKGFPLFHQLMESNPAWIRRPAVGQDQERAQAFRSAADVLEQRIGQSLVSADAHHSSQPESRRHHHRQPVLATWYIRPKNSLFSENGCTK